MLNPKSSTSQIKLLSPTNGSQLLTVVGKQQPSYRSKKLTIEDISPELAAEIVKNFILPMFESDNKKHLKQKYSRMGMQKQSKSTIGIGFGSSQQTSTVYGELKLSDLLNEQLKELKGKFDELQE